MGIDYHNNIKWEHTGIFLFFLPCSDMEVNISLRYKLWARLTKDKIASIISGEAENHKESRQY